MEMETVERLCFDVSLFGERAKVITIPPPSLIGGFRGLFEKTRPDRLLYVTIFKSVLGIINVRIRHLIGEKKWESSTRLDLNGMEIGGLKATKYLFQDRI